MPHLMTTLAPYLMYLWVALASTSPLLGLGLGLRYGRPPEEVRKVTGLGSLSGWVSGGGDMHTGPTLQGSHTGHPTPRGGLPALPPSTPPQGAQCRPSAPALCPEPAAPRLVVPRAVPSAL